MSWRKVNLTHVGMIRTSGRRWRLVKGPLRKFDLRGQCHIPLGKHPGIVIVSTHLVPGTPLHLETVIHETLHAADNDMHEMKVRRIAAAIGKALRAYGYGAVREADAKGR